MNEKIIHSFEGVCPLTYYGVYGIKKTFNMPNFPCSDTLEQMSLKKHLMYKHNLSNTAANKIVLDRMSGHGDEKKSHRKHELIFNNTQELFSHSVHWHKGRCPFSYGFANVFNLTSTHHQIKNYNCRHVKQCLLLSHLRVSHNLNIKSAKKIVKAMMSSAIENQQKSSIENDIQEIILFQKDDAVLNTNPNVYNDDRRFRHYCPLTNLQTQVSDQPLLNVPCNKSNEKFILFAHLQHYHQMSGEVALRLIRSIRMNLETAMSSEPSHSNNSKVTTSINPTVTDDMDIVPYKCLCPYSTTSDNHSSNLLKKFSRFVKNIPCDRPCPVNLYRHLRNYHKVNLQHAKEITRTMMLKKIVKNEEDPSSSNTGRKRVKLPKISTNFETTISLVRVDLSTVNSEMKNETVDLFINDENPDDWDTEMINDEESLFLSFDEERLNFDDIDKL